MKAFQPGLIGNLEIKNRLVMSPMISNLASPDGTTNENHIRYLEERAKGGAGLIITEYTYVDRVNSRGSLNELGAYSQNLIPKLRRITEAIHPYGAKVFMQLVHCGGKALWGENKEDPMAPSPVAYYGKIPRGMNSDDIENVTQSFENAAKVAKNAKFDGIELHGAHGYLIHQFISAKLNLREDRYGGTFDRRLTFPQEIIDAVRGEVDIPVGMRLSLYEDDPGDWTPEYGLKVSESLRNLDYVHFSAGNFYPPGSSASFYSPETHILSKLARKPRVTTMLVGSVLNRSSVERVLEKCDFVTIGRGMLADPYFSFKAQNLPDLIRPCIRCNQGCRDLKFGEVRCTVNPEVGHEGLIYSKLKGEVVIKGAGVQGLEASLFAEKHGLKVFLYEKDEQIGGQLNKVHDPFKKEAFSSLIQYYSNAIKSSGIQLFTDSKYRGHGIDCIPPIVYKQAPENAATYESNVFANHDTFLKLSEKKKIEVGNRSLESLDASRKKGYRELAEKKGIKFTDSDSYDFSLMVEDQYDISSAMILGRTKIKQYINVKGNNFL